jgi:hypothetical protein
VAIRAVNRFGNLSEAAIFDVQKSVMEKSP